MIVKTDNIQNEQFEIIQKGHHRYSAKQGRVRYLIDTDNKLSDRQMDSKELK